MLKMGRFEATVKLKSRTCLKLFAVRLSLVCRKTKEGGKASVLYCLLTTPLLKSSLDLAMGNTLSLILISAGLLLSYLFYRASAPRFAPRAAIQPDRRPAMSQDASDSPRNTARRRKRKTDNGSNPKATFVKVHPDDELCRSTTCNLTTT